MTRRTLLPCRLLISSALVGAALGGAPGLVRGQAPAFPRVSPKAIQSYIRFLADDALEGRGVGTRGGWVAAEFIAAQFRRMGLEPAGDSGTYFQAVELLGRTPAPTLSVSGAALRYPDDYVVAPVSDDTLTRVAGDLVFAGYGIVSAAKQWDDYKDADVRGKIVVVLPGDPDSTLFDRLTGRPWNAVREKADLAARRGAVAVLVVQSEHRGGPPWEAVLALTHERISLAAPAPSVSFWGWLSDSSATAIFARGGNDLARLRAAAASRDFRPVSLGLRLDAEVHTQVRRIPTANVVARLPGHGPRAAEAIVVGAHYDHLGIGEPVNGDSIYNGAFDNASGVAAMLAAAEAVAESGVHPARTMIFTAFTAEELGLQGSEWLVRHPPLGLRLVGAFAMDVLNLYGKTRDIGTVGVKQSSLGDLVRKASRTEGMVINEDPDDLHRGRFFRSDNYAFARENIPALRIVNGVTFVGRPPEWGREQREKFWNERYHKPNDELESWMSMDGIVQQTRVLARAALAAAQATSAPSWVPTSDFYSVNHTSR
ncbi:MAG TPA: M20/M25/M40 family metallo-hydrolase [Gemmatimonadales bacterium]|nr:M20/M25/M40 family metallo-hydrolase [Gemmatimonadales bacterium]